jgi:hypothetical protein
MSFRFVSFRFVSFGLFVLDGRVSLDKRLISLIVLALLMRCLRNTSVIKYVETHFQVNL